MTDTINVTGTGGIIEGDLGAANVNVNLDPIYGNFNADTSSSLSNDNDFDDMWAGNGGLFSAWIYPKSDGEGNFGRIADKNQWVFHLKDESSGFVKLNFTHSFSTTTGDWFTTNRVIPINAWSHIAVFYDSDSASNDPVIYVNGVSVAITEDSTPAGTRSSDASSDLIIGNKSDGSRGFDGYMMDIKIYKNTAWTQPEIAVLASKINVDKDHPGLPAPGPRLYLWWKAIADATTDSSGSGNNLTASNMGSVVYDEFSVDVYDNSTTTDGTFTVTQGKVEGKALSSVELNGSDDFININNDLESWVESPQKTFAGWVYNNGNSNEARVFNIAKSDPNSTGFALGFSRNSVNQPFYFLIDTGGSSLIADFGDVHSNNTWMHYAIVTDGANDKAYLYQNGVLQATVSNVGEISQASDVSAKIGKHWASGQPYYFNGKVRDFRLYDYDLSDEQVASLYSNTYPQTPLNHWKLDEGYTSGTTANTAGAFEDSGTGTDLDAQGSGLVNASCVNGTLDLDFDLVIAANGTLSAPRGTVSLVRNFQNSGTFTHNNGTFEAASGDNTFINTTATVDPVFYNVTHIGDQIRFYENTTIENSFVTASSSKVYIWTNRTLTMGTTTSAATLTVNVPEFIFYAYNSGHTAKLAGASSLYPIVITGSDNFTFGLNSGGQGIAQVENVDFQLDISTTANEYLQLTGDCEFDAVTIASGDTLDLSGQRMFTSGLVTISGDNGLKNTTDGSTQDTVAHLITNGIIASTTTHHASLSNVIYIADGGTNTHKIEYFDFGTFVSTRDGNINFGRYGPDSSSINVILANNGSMQNWGRTGSGANANLMNNLTIATGTTALPESTTLTVAGDFTTSGGLIGKSALTFDETAQSNKVAIPDDSTLDLTTAGTLMAWVKIPTDAGSKQRIISKNFRAYEMSVESGLLSGYHGTDGAGSFNSTKGTSDLRDGKWHHCAITFDGSSSLVKIYVDGKLENQESTPVSFQNNSSDLSIGYRSDGTTTLNDNWMDGEIAVASVWNNVLTEAQIRSKIFSDFASLDSNTGCVAFYQFDEGSGTAVADSTSNNNDGTASSSSLWVGAGTFTYGTSTLNMTGDGTMNIPAGFDVYNLTAGASSKTTTIALPSNGSDLDVYGTLTVDGGTLTDTNNADVIIRGTAPPVVNGSSTLENLWRIQNISNMTMPATTYNILLVTSSSTCTSGGNMTINTELEVASGSTFNANTNTIAAKNVDINGGTLDLRNSTLNFSVTSSGDIFTMDASSTLLSGNTAINGHSSGAKTLAAFAPSGGFEVVGDVKHLSLDTDTDLTVVGAVIDCDISASGANIRQWHHTLDTQQLLDADEAGDDDLRLERPALDNANELQTG